MKKCYILALVLFTVIAVASYGARTFGWYNDYWYTDIILHTVSGVALGAFWLGLNYYRPPRFYAVAFLGIVSFAVFGSVLWEFWEFAGWRVTPSHTQFYTPRLGDTLLDVFCGLVGGVFWGIVSTLHSYIKNKS